MKNQFINRQRKPFNEIIINNASELPTPTDTGDGLGTAYRFENKVYKFGSDLSVAYPFVLNSTTLRGYDVIITYTGTGALFRNNTTTPLGYSYLSNIGFIGDGTNQAFSITDGVYGAFLDVYRGGFVDFEMGEISNIDEFFMITSAIYLPVGKLTLENIAERISLIDFGLIAPTPIGDSLIEIIGSPKVTAQTVFLEPSGSDSAFNIDSGFTGSFDFSHSKVLGNGIAFNPGGLDQTNPYVTVIAVSGISDSQTIGSLFMERNATITDITAVGADGDITVFADAGGGQVTVTSAGHGLGNGEEIWIANSTNYNSKYTVSNVTTDTFEITETYVAESPLPITRWETEWTKVAGTTYPMENERASMTGNNKVTFTNLEEQKVTIHVSTNPRNDQVAATKDWEFAVIKNGTKRLRGSLKYREMNNKAGEGVITTTESVISGDYFEVYARSLSDTTTDMAMENMSMVIE